ncbi:MAG: hypothetical protein HQ522_13925 [Bacteroidetes bacterium]|nr:hypothetical protein [Bacteroidota bacterium]
MSKFKFITALFIISILSAGVTALAEEKTKEYNETWAASSVQSLEITNKFGEIKVKNEGGSEITIDVVVTVEARDERRADDLLDQIEVEFTKSGSSIKATTTIENNFKSQRKFSIDYVVNIPSDKNLKISNKYGSTIVNSLTGNGDFNIQYGNFSANELKGASMKILLAYGKANVSSASDLNVEVKYSGMTFGEISNLKIDSKYSSVDIEEGKSIEIASRYDKFDFEEVESVTATTKYSHLRIEELAKNLKIEAGYGSVKVGQVNSGFESISITNSYGQISLGLDDASYNVDASCEYCGISYPEEEFSGDKMKERNTKTIKGKVGSASGGKVYIRSRYGEINLRD